MIQDNRGNWQLVHNVEEWQRQKDKDSHVEYMKQHIAEVGLVGGEDGAALDAAATEEQLRNDRQALRRAANYRDLALNTFLFQKRADPTLKEIRVTDEAFKDMHEAFLLVAQDFKEPGDLWKYAEEDYFIPMSAYVHKLQKKDGSWFRPLLKGEVGMIGQQIVVLQPGYGTGNTVNVIEKVGGKLWRNRVELAAR